MITFRESNPVFNNYELPELSERSNDDSLSGKPRSDSDQPGEPRLYKIKDYPLNRKPRRKNVRLLWA